MVMGMEGLGQKFGGVIGQGNEQAADARCKPDYEGMIVRARERHMAAVDCKDAIKRYMRVSGFPGNDDGVFAMLGFLDVQADRAAAEIEIIIKQQEADKG